MKPSETVFLHRACSLLILHLVRTQTVQPNYARVDFVIACFALSKLFYTTGGALIASPLFQLFYCALARRLSDGTTDRRFRDVPFASDNVLFELGFVAETRDEKWCFGRRFIDGYVG